MAGYAIAGTNRGSGSSRSWNICIDDAMHPGLVGCTDLNSVCRASLLKFRCPESSFRSLGIRIPSTSSNTSTPEDATDTPEQPQSAVDKVVNAINTGIESVTGEKTESTESTETTDKAGSGSRSTVLPWVLLGTGALLTSGFVLYLVMRNR